MKNQFLSVLFRGSLLLGFALLQTHCASIPSDPHSRGPFLCPEWIKNQFADSTQWVPSAIQMEGFQQITLTPASPDSPHKPIVLDFYRSNLREKGPALLVSPILGGKNKIASHFARYFSRQGYHSLVIHRPKDLTHDLQELKQLDDRLRQAVIRDRAALDWLCQQPEVNPEALGSFGVSYGGIKNTILAGVDNRLKANVIALAGADLASMVTHSNHKAMQRIYQYALESGASTQQAIEQQIREVAQTDPMRFAPFIDPSTTLLILARNDHTVPRANGELLRKWLGRPRTLYLPCAHYSAALFTGILGFPYVESITREFFDEHLLPIAK